MRFLHRPSLMMLAAIPSVGCGSLGSDSGSPVLDASADAPGPPEASGGDGDVTQTDATLDADDSAPEAGLPDTGPTVSCDGGDYFIAVGDDAGSQVLRAGCGGFLVPTLFVTACKEDCPCSAVSGCSDASSLDLRFADSSGLCSTVQAAGVYPIATGSWTSAGAVTQVLSGWIHFDAFPPSPSAVSGDYSVTLFGDGGDPGDTLGGTFCIQQ